MSTANGLPAGYTLRPVTRDDAAAVTDFVNLCFVQEVGRPLTSEEEVLNEWGTPGLDLQTDCPLILAPDGSIAAYAEFWNITEPRVRPFLFARVHPDHRGRGLGTHLMHWAEDRARSYIPELPAEARVSLRVAAIAFHDDNQALFASEDYTHVRTFYRMRIVMESAPPAPVWPDGITVRTLRDTNDDLRLAHAANEEAFADHWGHLPVAFEKWQHWVENDPKFDPTLWFLAMDGDEVAGTCFCLPEIVEDPDMGWVDDLGVRRPWRRRGLGQAFLLHAFGEFWRRGQRKVGLGVDATSLTNATRLYEKVGMVRYHESRQYEKELRPGVELATETVEA